MQPWCLLGQNPLFDSLIDAIHANGGYLARVVTNVPDPARSHGPSFATRLQRYNCWLDQHHPGLRCEELSLDAFQPDPSHHHFPGFYGPRLPAYLDALESLHPGLRYPSIIHPQAEISPFAEVGQGSFISPGSVVGPWATVGAFSQIRVSYIAHDCVLHPHAYLLPGCILASDVTVHSHAMLCVGTKVIPGITLGRGCVVAPGSVVRKDVPDLMLVAGNPARQLRQLSPLPSA